MFVGIGRDINVAIIEVVIGEVPVPVSDVSYAQNGKIWRFLRLVKANSMGKYLDCRVGHIVYARHAELNADIVCASSRRVT